MNSIANELITRGWCQGRTVNPVTGEVCLTGAAACAAGLEPLTNQATSGFDFPLLARYLAALRKACGRMPADYNDVATRTFDEVLRVAKIADEIMADDVSL